MHLVHILRYTTLSYDTFNAFSDHLVNLFLFIFLSTSKILFEQHSSFTNFVYEYRKQDRLVHKE